MPEEDGERLLKQFIEAIPKSQKKRGWLRIDWDEMYRERSG